MARSNTGSTSNRFSTTDLSLGVPAAAPLTIASWFNPANLTTNQNLVFIVSGGGNDYFGLIFDGANANGKGDNVLLAECQQAGVGTADGVSGTGGTAGSWMHCAAVFTSGTSRTAYMNGVGGTANTTSIVPISPTGHIDVGCLSTPTVFSPLNGSLAEVCIWDVALSAADVLMLAKGVSPLRVRPNNLVRYWPLFGRTTTEPDLIAAAALTQTGTMAQADHPLIVRGRVAPGLPAAATAVANGVGSASGTGAAAATGAALAAGVGTASGAGTALGVGAAATAGLGEGIGSAAGTGTAQAVSAALAMAVGTAGSVGEARAYTPDYVPGGVTEGGGGGTSRAYAKRLRQAIERRRKFEKQREQRFQGLTLERPPLIPAPETVAMIAVMHEAPTRVLEDDGEEEELLLLLLAS
jgi:hypothetical protein